MLDVPRESYIKYTAWIINLPIWLIILLDWQTVYLVTAAVAERVVVMDKTVRKEVVVVVDVV
jgi:hypothetical protein